jgi:hypothetical protein
MHMSEHVLCKCNCSVVIPGGVECRCICSVVAVVSDAVESRGFLPMCYPHLLLVVLKHKKTFLDWHHRFWLVINILFEKQL